MPAIITKGAFSASGFGFGAAPAGATTGTVGIFALGVAGVASTTRNKYTYACDTNGTATAASAASSYGSAASNGTTCVNI